MGAVPGIHSTAPGHENDKTLHNAMEHNKTLLMTKPYYTMSLNYPKRAHARRLDLGLVGAGYAYALCKATNAMLLLGWLGWRILRGPEQQQQQQHLASKEVAVAEGEEGAEGGAAGAAAALGKADASGGGPLKLADLRLVEAQKARAEQKKREQQQRLLEGRQGESSEGRRQKRGEHGMDGNAHEEILTPPLAAAASAPEFNLGHEGAMAAAKVESSGDASRRGTGTALAAAAAGTGTAAVAAAAMPTAWGGLLHGRGAEMWAAVKAEMVEVFDLRACWEYVKFGFPAAVMSCLEWWAYEALVIMAGARGKGVGGKGGKGG